MNVVRIRIQVFLVGIWWEIQLPDTREFYLFVYLFIYWLKTGSILLIFDFLEK